MITRDYSRLQSAFADRIEVAEADWWPERRRAFDTALAKIAAGRSPLVVQGAAGVGKSSFLTSLLQAIEPLRKTSLVSAADVPPTSATANCAADPSDSHVDPGNAPADCERPGVLLVDDLHLAEEWWVRRMVAPCPDCPASDVSHPRPLLIGTTERRALRSGLPGLGGEEDIGADNCIVLNPMTRTDVEAFVEARLIRAGYDGPPPFTEEAMDRIQFYSRGLPGRVTRLCRAALTVAAERGAWPVGEALMREVAWSLFLPESLKDRLPALGHSRPEAGPGAAGAPEDIAKALAAADPEGLAAPPAAALEDSRAAPARRSRRSSARRLSVAAVACFAAGIGIAVHLASEGAGPQQPEPQLASETVPESPPALAVDAVPDIVDQDPPERAPDLAPTISPQPQPAFAVAADPEPMPELASPPAPEPVAAADSGLVPDMAASDALQPEAMVTATPAAAPVLDVDCAAGATDFESAADFVSAAGVAEAPPECGRVSPEDRAHGPSHPLPQEAPQEVPQQVSEVPERPLSGPNGETSSSPMLMPEVPERPQVAPAVDAPSGPTDVDLAPERKRRPPARARTPIRAPSERVATAQGLLAQLGYSPGPVDGAEGPRTRRAIRAYQTRHGLPATGVVDDRVLASLRGDTATQRTPGGSPSLFTSVIRTISATVGPRVDSVEDPGSVIRYCRNNRDTWVYDFGKDRPVFCKYIDLPDG